MKLRLIGFIFMAVLIVSQGFGVSTKYIRGLDLADLQEYQLSNIAILEDNSLELARSYQSVFKSENIIWSMESYKDGFLAGCGETANLLYIDDKTNYNVFSKSNYILFSDIWVSSESIYVAAIPKAVVFELGKDYTIKKEYAMSNAYAWDIVPAASGFYVLAGNPAAIFYFEKGVAKFYKEITSEKNLLKGSVIDGDLYFSGEKNLYRLKDGNVSVVATFDRMIADFIYTNDCFYVITSVKDLAAPAQKTGNGENTKTTSTKKNGTAENSALFMTTKTGIVEKLFEAEEVRFVSVSVLNGKLIIGTDKNGGYFESTFDANSRKFSSVAAGKFVKFYAKKDKLYGILIYPSQIVRFEDSMATKGSFISKVFDTGNVSVWGTPTIDCDPAGRDQLTLLTRTSTVNTEEYWEEWKVCDSKVASSPARFVQYQVQLTTAGKKKPVLRNVTIPFVQENISPTITGVEIKYNAGSVTLKWSAEDKNGDALNYDCYLMMRGKQWVKINSTPITDTSVTLNNNAFPSGEYRMKVLVSDQLSNPQGFEKDNFAVGNWFLMDDKSPEISDLKTGAQDSGRSVEFTVSDEMMPIFSVEYCINGEKWIKILPNDLIYDTKTEAFKVALQTQASVFFQIRCIDALGNTTYGGLLIEK